MSGRLIYGINAVRQMLLTHPSRIQRVYLQADLGRERQARLADALPRAPVLTRCSAEELERLTATPKHQGVAALVAETGPLSEAAACELLQALERPLVLVLDGVQDPRNFGACLRTADAAGADLVVVPRNRNVALTPVVSKVAAGAAESLPVAEVGNLARFLTLLKEAGLWIVGTDAGAGQTLYEVDLTTGVALVLGAEGEGLRRLTRERCDHVVGLPMQGTVESLNVAVAAGICLYECLRQRTARLPGQGPVR